MRTVLKIQSYCIRCAWHRFTVGEWMFYVCWSSLVTQACFFFNRLFTVTNFIFSLHSFSIQSVLNFLGYIHIPSRQWTMFYWFEHFSLPRVGMCPLNPHMKRLQDASTHLLFCMNMVNLAWGRWMSTNRASSGD